MRFDVSIQLGIDTVNLVFDVALLLVHHLQHAHHDLMVGGVFLLELLEKGDYDRKSTSDNSTKKDSPASIHIRLPLIPSTPSHAQAHHRLQRNADATVLTGELPTRTRMTQRSLQATQVVHPKR